MDIFQSLPLDLKLLAVGIVVCALLALFAGNHGTEKRYLVVLAVLAAVGVYRFTQVGGVAQADAGSADSSATHFVKAPDKHVPLASTSAK
jgi:hypothetical protein